MRLFVRIELLPLVEAVRTEYKSRITLRASDLYRLGDVCAAEMTVHEPPRRT